MKKFKEFYSKIANPQTPADWIARCLHQKENQGLAHDRLQGRELYGAIQAHLKADGWVLLGDRNAYWVVWEEPNGKRVISVRIKMSETEQPITMRWENWG